MRPYQLRQILDDMRLTVDQAAAELEIDPFTLQRFLRGRTVPRYIGLALRRLQQLRSHHAGAIAHACRIAAQQFRERDSQKPAGATRHINLLEIADEYEQLAVLYEPPRPPWRPPPKADTPDEPA